MLRKISRDLITIATKRRKNRIILITESSCGSNTYALWKNASQDVKNKYEVIIYQDSPDENIGITNFIRKHTLISSSQLIVTTHASYKPSRKHIHLQCWHGASTKNSGIMESSEKNKFTLPWKTVDYIMSYSETYTTFLNAQMLSAPWKYKITGAPRNDLLFHSDGMSNLIAIFGDAVKRKKIIFYLPTYRKASHARRGVRSPKNIFGFSEFFSNEFDAFLENNNCKLIYKPHPHENDMAVNVTKGNNLRNTLIFQNDDLLANDLDLYEVLNAADILITDYSSVFYDFLLLEKPMIFSPTDIESYLEKNGFLIESFENWAPGPLTFCQDELQLEISKCLELKDYYAEKRSWMRNLHHRYKDGNSYERLWSFIEKIMPTQ